MKRARMGHPLIALACVLWLGVDAWTLRHVNESIVGKAILHTYFIGHHHPHPIGPGPIALVPDGDGFTIGNADGMSYDDMERAFASKAGVMVAQYETYPASMSFWAPAIVDIEHRFFVTPLVDLSQASINAAQARLLPAREAVARWFEQDGNPELAAKVRRAPRIERFLRWENVARNTVAGIVALVLGASLLALPAWLRERRRLRRIETWATGTCPGCGYEARELMKCPECGGQREREESE